jgi:hypothetical protein
MCCPLHHLPSNFVLTEVLPDHSIPTNYRFHGFIDFSPKTIKNRLLLTFQRLEFTEKIAEIADETFHLFGFLLKKHTNPLVYETFHNLHHGAHEIEHFLHSFCFLGDLSRLVTGKFLEYTNSHRNQVDYIRTGARVCHAISHLFATLSFLSERRLLRLGKLEPIIKYQAILSATGYGLWTISLIWQRFQHKKNVNFSSDLAIHGGGFLFEGLEIAKSFNSISAYASIINKVRAIAGIIHAWSIASRLMPSRVEVHGQIPGNQENLPQQTKNERGVESHSHSLHCHH